MEFRLLGEYSCGPAAGRWTRHAPPQPVLARSRGRRPAGPIETLVDRGEWRRRRGRNVLYSHLSRIRQLLRAVAPGSSDALWVCLGRRPVHDDVHRFSDWGQRSRATMWTCRGSGRGPGSVARQPAAASAEVGDHVRDRLAPRRLDAAFSGPRRRYDGDRRGDLLIPTGGRVPAERAA